MLKNKQELSGIKHELVMKKSPTDLQLDVVNLTNANVTNLICVYFASKFDKNAYFEIKFYKTE